MLPQELSTGICSLRPGEDRLVLSCIMQLDSTGRIESYEIVEGVIRSAARMTYTEVTEILGQNENLNQNGKARKRLEGDAEARARHAALVPEFERMRLLAGLMNKRREERGSIDFDLPEPVIEFDEQGQMHGITRAERTWANRLIEEFMLAANECVATWLEDLGAPSLYRIHEKPEPRRVVQLRSWPPASATRSASALCRSSASRPAASGETPTAAGAIPGCTRCPKTFPSRRACIRSLPPHRGQAGGADLSYLMLRSLKQARYSERSMKATLRWPRLATRTSPHPFGATRT